MHWRLISAPVPIGRFVERYLLRATNVDVRKIAHRTATSGVRGVSYICYVANDFDVDRDVDIGLMISPSRLGMG